MCLHQQELLQTAYYNYPFVFRLLLELLVDCSVLGFFLSTSHPEGPTVVHLDGVGSAVTQSQATNPCQKVELLGFESLIAAHASNELNNLMELSI